MVSIGCVLPFYLQVCIFQDVCLTIDSRDMAPCYVSTMDLCIHVCLFIYIHLFFSPLQPLPFSFG